MVFWLASSAISRPASNAFDRGALQAVGRQIGHGRTMTWRLRGFIKTAAAQGVKPSGGGDLQNVAADGYDSDCHTVGRVAE